MTAREVVAPGAPGVVDTRLPDDGVLFYVDVDDREAADTRAALRSARERAALQDVACVDELARPIPYPAGRLVIDARPALADLDPSALPNDAELGSRGRALIVIRERRHALLREWQDEVTSGSGQAFDDWLSAHRRLGSRQREVLERWVDRLGAGRLTVIVPCTGHLDVLRGLEELAGLDAGTLTDEAPGRALTRAEIEAIRSLNDAVDSSLGAWKVNPSLVGKWASAAMAARAPTSDELGIGLPAWAEEQVRGETADLVAMVNGAQISVIGSLACLAETPPGVAGGIMSPGELPAEAAGLLALGIVDGLRIGRDGGPSPSPETRELAFVPVSRLVAEMASRPARALGGVLHLDRGRRGPTARPGESREGTPIAKPQLALPRGTRLLHIGPSKTGTTALQAALDRARDAELQQGVRYVGWRRHARAAVLEATGKASRTPSRGAREWRAIVRDLQRSTEFRTIFSSEELAHGDSAFVRRFVDDIGPSRVHVAVTLRPLARILPSVWQQIVTAGSATPFDLWLRKILLDREAASGFWQRHRHDELIKRWAAVVGTGSVTAIVVDDRDQANLPKAFEGLLGLEPGTLRLHRDLSNRSLTLGEIEAIRTLNSHLEQEGLGWELRRMVVGLGASQRMRLRDPGPGEVRIQLPAWAEDTVGEIARDMVDGIAGSGVRVIGDLQRLTALGPARSSGRDTAAHLPPAAAAAMAIGVLQSARLVMLRDQAAGTGEEPEDREWLDSKLAAMPVRDLGRVIARRAQGVGVSLVQRATGHLPRGGGAPD